MASNMFCVGHFLPWSLFLRRETFLPISWSRVIVHEPITMEVSTTADVPTNLFKRNAYLDSVRSLAPWTADPWRDKNATRECNAASRIPYQIRSPRIGKTYSLRVTYLLILTLDHYVQRCIVRGYRKLLRAKRMWQQIFEFFSRLAISAIFNCVRYRTYTPII